MQASTPTSLSDEVASTQVRLLYRNALLGTVVNVVTAWLLVWLHTHGSLSGAALPWLIYMMSISALRLVLAFLYRQHAQLPKQTALWRNLFVAGVALAGAGWMATIFIFMPAGDIVRQSATALVLAGMAAGAVPILSAVLIAYYLFIALTLIPASIHFFLSGDITSIILGLMALLMVVGLLQSARYLHQTLLETLVLSAERASLAASLEKANAVIAKQNKQLLVENQVRREAEAEMLKAKDAAEAANKAKGEFLAHMNHEIRTPLSAVIGMAEIALDTGLTEDQRHYLSVIDRSSRAMLDILNNIRDLSRLESGRLRVESVSFDLHQLLDELGARLRIQADRKRLSLHLDIAPEVPRQLSGDPGLLRQVLGILAGNAVKFTDAGKVQISVGADPASLQRSLIRFAIRDTGIGIAKDKHASVLEAFSQADNSITRRFGGIGLGLTIAHKLVMLMGGKLSFDSEEGKGSEFRFELEFTLGALPAQTAAGKPETATIAAPPRLGEVLLVDDDADNQELVKFVLRHAGYSVSVAQTGKEALDRIMASRFDAVLMDLHMPVMDGFEAARAIREFESKGSAMPGEEKHPGNRVPIIGLTANILPETREQCLQAGMDDYLVKPVRRETLLAALRQWVAGAARPADSQA